MSDLDTLKCAYLEAIEFTDMSQELEDEAYGCDLSPHALDRIDADCRSFYYRASAYIDVAGGDYVQAGHDFWLSRNHHGAGFWDGDWPDPYGDILDTIAKSYGEVSVIKGDDGLAYVE